MKEMYSYPPISNIIRPPVFVPAITFNVDFGTNLSTEHSGNFCRQAHVSLFFKSKTLQLPLFGKNKHNILKLNLHLNWL